MNRNFSGYTQKAKTPVRIEAQEIPQRDSFHYLGSEISKDVEIVKDIEHMIEAGWLKWKLVFGVLYVTECQQD